MKRSYGTSPSQYNVEISQVGLKAIMEQIPNDRPSITFYDHEHQMQVIITSTNEKTLKEVDAELSPLLTQKYMEKLLSK